MSHAIIIACIGSCQHLILNDQGHTPFFCIAVTSHWGHGVSNHQHPDCLFNSWFRLAKRKLKLCITSLLWGKSTSPNTGSRYIVVHQNIMMTSSNGNIFRVTGHLCGQFTDHRWIPHTKASDAELWCFSLICARINGGVNSWGWWFETPSLSFWRHCNVTCDNARNGKGWHLRLTLTSQVSHGPLLGIRIRDIQI